MKGSREILLLNFPFHQLGDIITVRQRTRQIMELLRFKSNEQTRMTTAVSEITRNACQYAQGGIIQYSVKLTSPVNFMVNIVDKGKGIPNLEIILDEKKFVKTGQGLGIIGARRLVDVFTIHSSEAEGTRVSLGMETPLTFEPSPLNLGKIAEELVRHRPKDVSEELLQQNQELMQAFNLLKSAREELEQRVAERTMALSQANEALKNEIERRKGIEQSLREITEHLYLTLESARVGTWRWNFKTNELLWDKYACALFGIKPDNFDNTFENFLELLPVEERGRFQRENTLMIQKKTNQAIEFRMIWPDGSIHYLMSRGRVYYDAQGMPSSMIGIYIDITEHTRTKQELQTYREKMLEVSRASSLGEMASSLAHEINQPLAAINAYISGCIKRIASDRYNTVEIVSALQEARQQAERTGQVIHRIKNFVRKGQLFYEKAFLEEIITEVLRIMDHEIRKFPVEIIYQPFKLPFPIYVDKIQIQQVIINLIRNAMEAMQGNNSVNPKIMIEMVMENQDFVKIKIIDNGPGFSGEIFSRLFDTYFTTKPQGMGLGLSICRSIIEAHGGQLIANNLDSGGCCFEFNLSIREKAHG